MEITLKEKLVASINGDKIGWVTEETPIPLQELYTSAIIEDYYSHKKPPTEF